MGEVRKLQKKLRQIENLEIKISLAPEERFKVQIYLLLSISARLLTRNRCSIHPPPPGSHISSHYLTGKRWRIELYEFLYSAWQQTRNYIPTSQWDGVFSLRDLIKKQKSFRKNTSEFWFSETVSPQAIMKQDSVWLMGCWGLSNLNGSSSRKIKRHQLGYNSNKISISSMWESERLNHFFWIKM